MKAIKIYDRALVLLSAGLLLFFCIALLVSPQKTSSERENRMLRTWEMPTWQTLADGSFFGAIGAVTRDQFPMRERWIMLKARCEQMLGKRENNGILLGEDGYLMARNEYVDRSVARDNLGAVEVFSESFPVAVTSVWLPRSSDVMTEYLPSAYPSDAADALYETAEGSPYAVLKAAAERGVQVYYRTDHHLTTEGAYLLYCSLGKTLGYTPRAREEFSVETVSNAFFGSADAAAGGIAPRADTVELYRYEGDERFLVTDATTGAEREGFYDRSALDKKDQYAVFLGGNFAHLSVREEASDGKPRLLLVKDSFANALVPFLAQHFDLEIVDLRYATGEILVDACDRVLILQGVDTLATDRSLARIGLIQYKNG